MCGVFCKTTVPPNPVTCLSHPWPGSFFSTKQPFITTELQQANVNWVTRPAQEKLSYHFFAGDWGNKSHSSPPYFKRGAGDTEATKSEGPPALAHISCLPPWRTAWNITYNKQIMPKMFIKHYYFKIKTFYNLIAIYITSSILLI